MSSGVQREYVETFSTDIFELGEPRTVCGNKGAGVGIMNGLEGPDGMRMEGMKNFFGYEG